MRQKWEGFPRASGEPGLHRHHHALHPGHGTRLGKSWLHLQAGPGAPSLFPGTAVGAWCDGGCPNTAMGTLV